MVKQKRKSAKLKTQMVLDLLRGRTIEEVSREYQVTIADLTEWRTAFLRGGEAGLKKRPDDSRYAEYERTVGRLQTTEKIESNMIMKRKANIDNGLQDWKTEHQAVTSGIVNCRCSGYSSGTARIKSNCNLTGKCFEIGN